MTSGFQNYIYQNDDFDINNNNISDILIMRLITKSLITSKILILININFEVLFHLILW